jgi:simple sugar transport system permease protein
MTQSSKPALAVQRKLSIQMILTIVAAAVLVVWLLASPEMLDFLKQALINATPLALGAYAGIMCERAGVVNIAIEGMMLIGACIAQLIAQYAFLWLRDANGNPDPGTAAAQPFANSALLLGLIVALLVGAFFGWAHAHISIRFKANQIISGTVINILALGVTGWIYQSWMLPNAGAPLSAGTLPSLSQLFNNPDLVKIPILGPFLFERQPIFVAMLVMTLVINYVLFFTPWGLRVRSVGEHPKAADTVGINVIRTRYTAVIIGGMIAALAGAWLTIENIGVFNLRMTSGRGFIALAAMIFGRWMPLGAFGAAMLFGLGRALEIRAAGLSSVTGSLLAQIPSQFFSMIPYVMTILALAVFGGRAFAPAADGVPYEKESSEEGHAPLIESPPGAVPKPGS